MSTSCVVSARLTRNNSLPFALTYKGHGKLPEYDPLNFPTREAIFGVGDVPARVLYINRKKVRARARQHARAHESTRGGVRDDG